MEYPAVHHSETFRMAYHPAYRVIANEYVEFLHVFSEIDKRLCNGSVIIVIEGGSASGKTTLASLLEKVYDCNVLHMDDFFLRPSQRTVERLAEIGGNIDRERFCDEIIRPLKKNETICYRRFDCSTQTLGESIVATPKQLTVIEGVYSMHPAFDQYYDFSVFLDIDAESQKNRIVNRNSIELAKRFFSEWIPLENEYFEKASIRNRADLSISAAQFD
jgi:uridine kinase